MHVIVVGCGRVGSALARQLIDDGHSVAVIDKFASELERLGPDFGGQTVVGIGFDRDRLIQAGIERADALAAVTSGDNSNVLIARVARETFGVERVVARIYDPARASVYQRLGLTTVATVAWTTEQVMRRLLPATVTPEWTDPSAKLAVIERPVSTAIAGRAIADLEEGLGVRVIGISRRGEASLPGPKSVAQDGDLLYLAVNADDIDQLDDALRSGAHHGGH